MGTTPLDILNRALFMGPSRLSARENDPNPWYGRTALNSGTATTSVATVLVNSDSLIFVGVQAATSQASGYNSPIEVRSINPGVGFVLAYADGNARARNATIMWEIKNPKDTS